MQQSTRIRGSKKENPSVMLSGGAACGLMAVGTLTRRRVEFHHQTLIR